MYLVSAYAPGGTLAKRLENGPLAIDLAVEIVASVADSLDYAHKVGMVHRDIKPANILMRGENDPASRAVERTAAHNRLIVPPCASGCAERKT